MRTNEFFNMERLLTWITRPRGQTSLFQNVRYQLEPNALLEMWQLLRHRMRSMQEARNVPRTRASLFNYLEKPAEASHLEWKGLLKDLFTGYRFALWIPSLWADQKELMEASAQLRTRKMEAGMASLAIHAAIATITVLSALTTPTVSEMPPKETTVFISTPMHRPALASSQEGGGGGGGGGKRELVLPSGGRLPDAAGIQLMPPDPDMPKPLVPPDEPLDLRRSVQIPIDLPADASLPIGDITAPLGNIPSFGPGTGGGVGTGKGPGVGPGNGPGAGTGENGGYGNGRDGGIGDHTGPYIGRGDLITPEVIYKPTPYYTEEARKARTEGIVLVDVVIRANGMVDGFRILKGIGHGLDESAIRTIGTQWRFKPARYRGVPIDYPASIEITFRLY